MFLIISGLSGSGKSSLLRKLEDLDYLISDNIPPALWLEMYQQTKAAGIQKVAVSTDARTRAFLSEIEKYFSELKTLDPNIKVIFLEALDETLLARYNLSRREHPLGKDLFLDFAEEKNLLSPLRALADFVIDTTDLNNDQLEEKAKEIASTKENFIVRFSSFGFKHTPPRDSDLMIDVRTLPNPYYCNELKEKSGLEKEVIDYIFNDPNSENFYNQIKEFVITNLERAKISGRLGYSIAIGCTGGRHRSVAVAQRLANELGYQISTHRDLEKGHYNKE